MIDKNQGKKNLIERSSGFDFTLGSILLGIIQSAFSILTIGLAMVIFPIIDIRQLDNLTIESKSNRLFIHNLSTNTGVGFVTASIVILLVDSRSRRQSQREFNNLLDTLEENVQEKINILAKAEQDSIIFSLVPDKSVFKEIQNHLLRKDYILRNYNVEVTLEWDELTGKSFLIEKNLVSYSIENTSSVEITYPLKHSISNDEGYNQNPPNILEYTVNGEDKLEGGLREEIEKQRRIRDQEAVEITDELKINPKSSVYIEIKSEASRRYNYEEPWVISKIADGFGIHVSHHPNNILVNCIPLHPLNLLSKQERDKYYIEPRRDNFSRLLTWKIKTGVLPYQGLLLYWRKIN